MKFTIALDYDRKERVWNVSVLSMPGCLTWGKTKVEALRNACDAVRCYIDMQRRSERLGR